MLAATATAFQLAEGKARAANRNRRLGERRPVGERQRRRRAERTDVICEREKRQLGRGAREKAVVSFLNKYVA